MSGEREENCSTHVGDVFLCHVTHTYMDWGIFRYCQSARDEDERVGLKVDIIED